MLKQVFEEAMLNQKGTIDITYIWTDEGVTVSGRCDESVLMSHFRLADEPTNDATTGVDALTMALFRWLFSKGPDPPL